MKKLIVVVGPTAIGKTRLAIELAKHYQTEIISCDSRQFFKEMTIGTAVPESFELEQAKHHFIQHKHIFENYSVGDFERDAITLLQTLFIHKDVVIMVGGSGLYADAVIKGLDEFPEIPPEIREYLNQEYRKEGIGFLQELLKEKDSLHYSKVDIQNPQRMIRALEVCLATNKPYSSFLNKKKGERNFTAIEVGLTANRECVYEKINLRVERMLEQGLLCEVQDLLPYKNLNALQTVGYRELFRFFENEVSLNFAIEEIKKNTRNFAKRQFTWFRKNSNIRWFDHQYDLDEILTFCQFA